MEEQAVTCLEMPDKVACVLAHVSLEKDTASMPHDDDFVELLCHTTDFVILLLP